MYYNRLKRRLARGIIIGMLLSLGTTFTAFAGEWQQDEYSRWKWKNDDGTYSANRWQWIDGNSDGVSECYYFGEDGYLLTNTTTPDHYQVNESGAWIQNETVQTQGTVVQPQQTVRNERFVDVSAWFDTDLKYYEKAKAMAEAAGIDKYWIEDGTLGRNIIYGEYNAIVDRTSKISYVYDQNKEGQPIIRAQAKVWFLIKDLGITDEYARIYLTAEEMEQIAKDAGATNVELKSESKEVRGMTGIDSDGRFTYGDVTEWKKTVTFSANGFNYRYVTGSGMGRNSRVFVSR